MLEYHVLIQTATNNFHEDSHLPTKEEKWKD